MRKKNEKKEKHGDIKEEKEKEKEKMENMRN